MLPELDQVNDAVVAVELAAGAEVIRTETTERAVVATIRWRRTRREDLRACLTALCACRATVRW
jgi:hypothetical protein